MIGKLWLGGSSVFLLLLVATFVRAQNAPAAGVAATTVQPPVGAVTPGVNPKTSATQATDDEDEQLTETLVFADISVVHLLNAGIESTSGHVSTTEAGVRLGILVPVSSQLTLGGGVDGSENIYRFSGASGLVAPGVRPWGTIQTLGINIHGSYDINDHWNVFAGASGSSSGEQGAKFGSTLTGGGFAGFEYEFSKQLTLGLALFGESTLEANPTIVPFPVVDWALPFDPNHWRLEIGAVRAGPSGDIGAGVVYSPSKALSFAAGVAGVGLEHDFRLDRNGPVPDGVGRDSSVPLIISVDYRPNHMLSLRAFAGINTSDKVDLLNTGGGRVNRVDEDDAPLFGLSGSFRY